MRLAASVLKQHALTVLHLLTGHKAGKAAASATPGRHVSLPSVAWVAAQAILPRQLTTESIVLQALAISCQLAALAAQEMFLRQPDAALIAHPALAVPSQSAALVVALFQLDWRMMLS